MGESGRGTSFLSAWLRAGLGTAYTLVSALPSKSARARIIRLAREFGYDHRVGPAPTLPAVKVEAAVPEATIRIREPVSADGNVTLLELVVLDSFAGARQPGRIFEIGTFDGRTALNLAANAPEDARVYTLDLPASANPALAVHSDDLSFISRSQAGARGRRFHGTPESSRIEQLEGDSATFDYSPYLRTMDLVFVDGSHSYDYVMSDSRAALSLVAPNGLILWHDYGEWAGVTRALNELHAGDPRFSALRHISNTTLVMLEF